jgi:hypothetical protein
MRARLVYAGEERDRESGEYQKAERKPTGCPGAPLPEVRIEGVHERQLLPYR